MTKKKVLLLFLVGLAAALFFYFDLGSYLTIENLKNNRERLEGVYSSHKLGFVLTFIAVYVFQTALSLPGAAVLTIAGGAIFGAVMGTLYVNVGATTGATLAFLLARTLLGDWVVKKFGARMAALNQGLQESGLSYLLFLRLVPLFPFFLVNLACGITRLPLRTYVLGTMVGILPGSFVYANAGASLATIDTLSQVATPRVLGSFTLLGLFALIPAIYRKIKGRDYTTGGTSPEE